MNKILLIGETSAGKSSLVNLLSVELCAITSPTMSENNMTEYNVDNNIFKNLIICDTKGLDDEEQLEESQINNDLQNFLNNKEPCAKIVCYVVNRNTSTFSKRNMANIKYIKNTIDKSNNLDDYIDFIVIVNKCDLDGINIQDLHGKIIQCGIKQEKIINVISHQFLLDTAVEHKINVKVSPNFDKGEMKKMFRSSTYTYSNNIINDFNAKLIKHQHMKKKKQEDDEDEIQIQNTLFTTLNDIINSSMNIKYKNLLNIIKQDMSKIAAYHAEFNKIKDPNAETYSDEEPKNNDYNQCAIINNVIKNTKQIKIINNDNLAETIQIIGEKINEIVLSYGNQMFDLNFCFEIIKQNYRADLDTILKEIMSTHMKQIEFDSFFQAYYYLVDSYEKYDGADYDNTYINYLVTCNQMYNNKNINKLIGHTNLPMPHKYVLKMGTLPIETLKLLVNMNSINSDHLKTFFNDEHIYAKLYYVVNSTNVKGECMNERLIDMLKSDNANNFLNDYTFFKNE